MPCALPPDDVHDAEAFASALGHLCLSYATLELMLVRLMADMQGDGDLSAADRTLGRRGFSERTAILLKQAAKADLAGQQLDNLDMMLSEAAELAALRHDLVHDRYTICFQDVGIPAPEQIADMDSTAVWALVMNIDSLISALGAWSDDLNQQS